MNAYAQKLMGNGTGTPFADVIIDFSSTDEGAKTITELVRAAPQESLLSVVTKDGEPRSFLFSSLRNECDIWIMGRNDEQEIDTMTKEIYTLNQQLSNLSRELQKKNASLEAALAHVKTLQGILPICMHCHKIRNEKEVWDKLEIYIESHTDAEFSHSICHDCLDKYYSDNDEPYPDSFDEPNFSS